MPININPAYLPKQNFTMPGFKGNLPAVIPSPAAGLAPEAAIAPEVLAASPEAAIASNVIKRGMLARLASGVGAAANMALPITAGLAPMYFDKGSEDLKANTTEGSWASGLADEEDDLGITSLAKSWGRGAFNEAKGLVQPIVDTIDYLITPKGERDKKALEGKKPAESAEVQLQGGNELPGMGDFQGGGESGMQSPGEFVLPGLGGGESTGALDQLLQVMGGMKPEKGEPDPELQTKLFQANLWDALANPSGGFINTSPLNTLMAVKSKSDLQNAMQGLAADSEYAKNTQEWLKEYAKTAVDVEKVKNQAKKDNFKVHSTKGGFLLEMDEGGNKVLKPISFGGGKGAGKPQKYTVGGAKFTSDNPLTPELTVLQNLSDIGQIDGVLNEFNKSFMQDKDITSILDPKRQQEAKLLKLAVAMKKNPQLKQQMQTKYINTLGGNLPPKITPTFDWVGQTPSSDNGEPDYLTALTGGQ